VSTDASLRDFLTALAAAPEAQGAVSSSAVAGGMAASLLLRVAALPQTRFDVLDDRSALAQAATVLSGLREQLLETVETETAVKVFAARNLPQHTATQRAEREGALEIALQAAADIPLEVMRLSTLALTQAQIIAAHGCRAAANDVELAVSLLRVAFAGAQVNLETRLGSLTDVVYTKAVVDEIAHLAETATSAAAAAESSVRAPSA
jgi:formiminotetrahydrofolate cyclodeaminase